MNINAINQTSFGQRQLGTIDAGKNDTPLNFVEYEYGFFDMLHLRDQIDTWEPTFDTLNIILLIWDSEIIQIRLISILCSQAGIYQIAFFIVPLLQSSIVEHLQVILNNEWDDIIFQTFLEHNQPAHTTVTVLKRMDSLKLYMEIQNIFKGLFCFCVILCQQRFHLAGNFFRQGSLHATNFIGQFLIIPHCKPIFSGIAGSAFQNQMKLLDKLLSQSSFCMIDNHINTSKMICGFNHIVYVENFIFHTDGVSFKNIPSIVFF